jgi:tight adherence protein C
MSDLLWWAPVVLLAALAAGFWGLHRNRKAEQIAARYRALGGRPGSTASARWTRFTLETLLARLGGVLRDRFLGPATTREFLETLGGTGPRGLASLGAFVTAKIALLVLSPVLTVLAFQAAEAEADLTLMVAAAAAIMGLLLPDLAVGIYRRRRDVRIQKGLPDALDLLVICTEAGVPLESAVERVSRELTLSAPELAAELHQATGELQVAQDRRAALIAIGARARVIELRRLTRLLAETLRFGTPMAQALRGLAVDMRQQRLIEFEENASKLPVLLTLPMMLFILPCVFLIIGAPAVISILRTIGPL